MNIARIILEIFVILLSKNEMYVNNNNNKNNNNKKKKKWRFILCHMGGFFFPYRVRFFLVIKG